MNVNNDAKHAALDAIHAMHHNPGINYRSYLAFHRFLL